MHDREEMRDAIRGLVAKYSKPPETFVPGRTVVKYSEPYFDGREVSAAVEVMLDGWMGLSALGRELEERMPRVFGKGKGILTNSGSSANLLAISALRSPNSSVKLEAGDEVITTACCFPTTLNPIIQTGLKPVFVDIEEGSYTIDLGAIEASVGPRTKVLFFAHTLGNVADMIRLTEICRRHGLTLVEDCCDAIGGRFQGEPVGSFGSMATLSMYPSHHITIGEGGFVACSDEFHGILLSLRDWGRACTCHGPSTTYERGACGKRFSKWLDGVDEVVDHRYVFSEMGYNLKPMELQAAMGLVQLDKLGEILLKRRRNFEQYYGRLKRYGNLFVLPRTIPGAEPSWFSFPLTVREGAGFTRTEIVGHLERSLVQTRTLFAGNILRHPGYSKLNARVIGDLRQTDRVLSGTFFVGIHAGLSGEMVNYVCDRFDEFIEKITMR